MKNDTPQVPTPVPAAKYEMTMLLGRDVVGTGIITLYPDKLTNSVLARLASTDEDPGPKQPTAETLQRMADEIAFCYEVQLNARHSMIRTHVTPMAPEIPLGVQLENAVLMA